VKLSNFTGRVPASIDALQTASWYISFPPMHYPTLGYYCSEVEVVPLSEALTETCAIGGLLYDCQAFWGARKSFTAIVMWCHLSWPRVPRDLEGVRHCYRYRSLGKLQEEAFVVVRFHMIMGATRIPLYCKGSGRVLRQFLPIITFRTSGANRHRSSSLNSPQESE
jgi:hypothetical protein